MHLMLHYHELFKQKVEPKLDPFDLKFYHDESNPVKDWLLT